MRDERGDVFGWSPGSVTVTAEAVGLIATAPVIVFPAVASVRIEPASYTLEYWYRWIFWPFWGNWEHESVQLNAIVLDLLGNEINVPVTWTTSNSYYASVNGTGRVTANHHSGTATITAEAGVLVLWCRLDVRAAVSAARQAGALEQCTEPC